MDLTSTTAPRSDQLNYDDLANQASADVTIEKVTAGSSEQPVDVHLKEFPGRPWRPSKSMRRVLVAAWGSESEVYVGRKLRIYGDPSVKFGGIAVGGIRIAAMSHLDGPLNVALTVTRGKKAPYKVDRLAEPQPGAQPAQNSITPQVWSEIQQLATERGVENVGPWAAEQLSRKLTGPQDITEAEGDQLLQLLTTGEITQEN